MPGLGFRCRFRFRFCPFMTTTVIVNHHLLLIDFSYRTLKGKSSWWCFPQVRWLVREGGFFVRLSGWYAARCHRWRQFNLAEWWFVCLTIAGAESGRDDVWVGQLGNAACKQFAHGGQTGADQSDGGLRGTPNDEIESVSTSYLNWRQRLPRDKGPAGVTWLTLGDVICREYKGAGETDSNWANHESGSCSGVEAFRPTYIRQSPKTAMIPNLRWRDSWSDQHMRIGNT